MGPHIPLQAIDKKRVKVYELCRNDWHDRGTGFCTASFNTYKNSMNQYVDEPSVCVESEDEPSRLLLDTKIRKEDGFQKQQETLIVWTEPVSGVDMALSFQEAEGCAAIWNFVSGVQAQLPDVPGDDSLSDDTCMALEHMQNTINLPDPTLGNLEQVEQAIRLMSNTANGRETLAKYLIHENYIPKLVPLVEEAEDLESLPDLHRLCTIMKLLILLNDTFIIEYAVADEVVLGVVGALEYDPDFPSHKANHRTWLKDPERYKEVVRIDDEAISKKIHQTYRLQYLKDVVLARILDDPTFSVLNGLIFFNQVEILTHLQNNELFLKELFGIFSEDESDQRRRKDAVLFIQQCCAIAKNLQGPARQSLYHNFLDQGLLKVIHFALRNEDVAVRVGGTDILVSLIDHDPQMIRTMIFRQISEKKPPLTDSLIDLLLKEVDLGVKAQIADAIKVLLDPGTHQNPVPNEGIARANFRSPTNPEHEIFLGNFYEDSAKQLFKPLVDLKHREEMKFTVQEVSLFLHLVEILCFFIRQHQHRSKYFVMAENLGRRVSQLLRCPEKYLKLTAIKFFRNLVSLQDEFYNQQLMQEHLFQPVLEIVLETMPRDNLLNSACLELFEYIKRENIKVLIIHVVENYRPDLERIDYVDTFKELILRYEQNQNPAPSFASVSTKENTPELLGRRTQWQGNARDLDASEEEYFNASDEDDDPPRQNSPSSDSDINRASPVLKPLVDYNSDEDGDLHPGIADSIETQKDETTESKPSDTDAQSTSRPVTPVRPPLERVSEKRRREEDEEDELGKLSANKRRSSSIGSVGSNLSSGKSVVRNAIIIGQRKWGAR